MLSQSWKYSVALGLRNKNRAVLTGRDGKSKTGEHRDLFAAQADDPPIRDVDAT